MGLWPAARRPQIVLGTYGLPLLGRRFILGPEQVAAHKHVIGLTGQGKSKLLASSFIQLINQGEACALIDPHADLAYDVLSGLQNQGFFNQDGAFGRLLYVDFSDRTRFLPFNVLLQPYPAHDVARNIVETCKRAWPALANGSAPQFENILLAGSLVLIQNGAALTDLPRLLTDKAYRDGLLRQVTDPNVVSFFRERFDRWGREAPTMIESTLRRVFLLTFSPALRYSLGHSDNVLDFRGLMDRGISTIFNLSGLDADTQRFIGCLLTMGFEVAALSRADTPVDHRRRHHLIIDEFSQFSAQTEEALARVLSLARKYGLFLTLAHQTWSQVNTQLRGALQNSVDIAFCLGRGDAEWAAPRFGHFDPLTIKHEVPDPYQVDHTHPVFYSVQETFESWTQALMELPKRHAFVRVGNHTACIKTQAFHANTSEPVMRQITERYASQLLTGRESSIPRSTGGARRPTSRFVRIGDD
jgi:hypothetical protein